MARSAGSTIALADAEHLVRQLVEERSEPVLVDLAGREAVTAPGHAQRGHDVVAVAGVEHPAVLVFGLRQEPACVIGGIVVATHLLDVDDVSEPLHGLELFGGDGASEFEVHVSIMPRTSTASIIAGSRRGRGESCNTPG